jgi:hypothetical protein
MKVKTSFIPRGSLKSSKIIVLTRWLDLFSSWCKREGRHRVETMDDRKCKNWVAVNVTTASHRHNWLLEVCVCVCVFYLAMLSVVNYILSNEGMVVNYELQKHVECCGQGIIWDNSGYRRKPNKLHQQGRVSSKIWIRVFSNKNQKGYRWS